MIPSNAYPDVYSCRTWLGNSTRPLIPQLNLSLMEENGKERKSIAAVVQIARTFPRHYVSRRTVEREVCRHFRVARELRESPGYQRGVCGVPSRFSGVPTRVSGVLTGVSEILPPDSLVRPKFKNMLLCGCLDDLRRRLMSRRVDTITRVKKDTMCL